MTNQNKDIIKKVADDMIDIDQIKISLTKEEKRELIETAGSSKEMIRYLVDQYYQSQSFRIKAENQARALWQGYDESGTKEHPEFIEKELKMARVTEALNKKYMDILTDDIPICRWLKSIMGIGPVLSAYIYASFDINKGHYATDFLSYAGLNDNNNPWLGTEKAKAIVADAIEYRESRLAHIKQDFDAHCKWCGVEDSKLELVYSKLKSVMKKQINSEKGIDSVSIDTIINKVAKSEYSDIASKLDIYDPDVVEFFYCIGDEKFVGDIEFAYISDRCRRKVYLVKQGTYNNFRRSSKKRTYPVINDLISYLAKPPYNTDLKQKMFIIGDMFVKQSSRNRSLYGKIYKERKNYEMLMNDKGLYKDQADKLLEEKNWDKSTTTYKALSEGKLSDAHIGMRARRYAVKLFISHVYEAMYFEKYHEDAPEHYVIQHMGHHDYIAPEVDYKKFLK